jgi:hypothetical protein
MNIGTLIIEWFVAVAEFAVTQFWAKGTMPEEGDTFLLGTMLVEADNHLPIFGGGTRMVKDAGIVVVNEISREAIEKHRARQMSNVVQFKGGLNMGLPAKGLNGDDDG